jgi:hypothetical protein
MPVICEFIASRGQEYGVAPICRALGVLGVQIAPRTYRAHLARPGVEAGAVGRRDHRGAGRPLRAG